MASSIIEQIMENVRNGARLPSHAMTASQVVPKSEPIARPKEPTVPSVGIDQEFERLLRQTVAAIPNLKSPTQRHYVQNLFARVVRSELGELDAASSTSTNREGLNLDEVMNAISRLDEKINQLSQRSEGPETQQLLSRLDALSSELASAALRPAEAQVTTATSNDQDDPNLGRDPSPSSDSTAARVPLDDIQGMIEFLR